MNPSARCPVDAVSNGDRGGPGTLLRKQSGDYHSGRSFESGSPELPVGVASLTDVAPFAARIECVGALRSSGGPLRVAS
jgi:hypothetical protein